MGNSQKASKGAFLKQAREAKGLTIEIVHETTKIPMDVLRAIEEGYTVRTLSPFYYRGFVKIYAKYLDVPIPEETNESPIKEVPHVAQREELEEALGKKFSRFLNRQRKRQILIGFGILFGLFLVLKLFAWIKAHPIVHKSVVRETKEPKKKTKSESSKSSKVVETEPVALPAVVEDVSLPSSNLNETRSDKNVTLTVKAKRNSWLKVEVDGNVVFQSTLKKGAAETWSADDHVDISGRDLNQLEYELNGRVIGSLGKRDREARRVVVTKDGLSVKK